MPSRSDLPPAGAMPRPIADSYWVLPGRLLAGAHPGSFSRADAMDRLRRFLLGGVTCFIDLTEPDEMPSYEALLPFATPGGRRVEYFREPIRDHGIPANPESMERTLDLLDDALESGHTVYVHCRAGIGRSATVIACWLARRRHSAEAGLAELQELWQQSDVSRSWPSVPETAEQVDYVLAWPVHRGRRRLAGPTNLSFAERARGALLGLAVADSRHAASGGTWGQATALSLCLAESLLERGAFDARDQIERYVRWQREGHLSATGHAGEATPDVAKALATYRWRGQPMAGSHDPRDHSGSSLPRCISAVLFEQGDASRAIALAAECSRTTCQSPVVLDACRYYAAMLWGALAGEGIDKIAAPGYAPVADLWSSHPLRAELEAVVKAATVSSQAAGKAGRQEDALTAIAAVRACLTAAAGFADTVELAAAEGKRPLHAAVVGALAGAIYGVEGLPQDRLASLAKRDLIEQFAARFVERRQTSQGRA